MSEKDEALVRQFESGATRSADVGKYDYEAFLSPLVLNRYAAYMHSHRQQPDGTLRDGDNWQKGIPRSSYVKSMWRHFLDVWYYHRGCPLLMKEKLEESLCALIFNAMGYLHEHLKMEAMKTNGITEPTAVRSVQDMHL